MSKPRVKFFLSVTLAIVMCFSVFGSYLFDIAAEKKSDAIFSVDGRKFYVDRVKFDFLLEKEVLENVVGRPLTDEEIRSIRMINTAKDSAIKEEVFYSLSKRAGIRLPDAIGINLLVSHPGLLDSSQKNFERIKFDQLVKNSGITDKKAIEFAKRMGVSRMIENAISSFSPNFKAISKELINIQSEERLADVFLAYVKDIDSQDIPSEKEIDDYYMANIESFIVPGQKTARCLLVSSNIKQSLVDDPTEEEINNARSQISIDQQNPLMIFFSGSKDEAEKIAEDVTSAFHRKEYGNDIFKSAEKTFLAREFFTNDSPEIANKILSTEAGDLTGPIMLNSGWLVATRSPEKPMIEDNERLILKELKEEIKFSKATNMFYEISEMADREISSGNFDLNSPLVREVTETILMSKKPTSALEEKIMESKEGDITSALTSDGYQTCRIEKISEKKEQPKEDVREKIIDMIVMEKKTAAAKKMLENIANKGTSIPSYVDKRTNVRFLRESMAFTDNSTQFFYPKEMAEEIFNTKVGDTTDIHYKNNDDIILIAKVVSSGNKIDITDEQIDSISQKVDQISHNTFKENMLEYLSKSFSVRELVM